MPLLNDSSRRVPVACLIPLLVVFFSLGAAVVNAMDITPPNQPAGNHSTVATSDGSIRDDELIDHICNAIRASGGQVKDVKLMVNSCFGGGLLDDMQRAFGPGGACAGIPWVAGTAANADESAYGFSDATVDEFADQYPVGSAWTNALTLPASANANNMPGVLRGGSASNNVQGDMQRARNRDLFGPNGDDSEHPQVASGNGGHQVMWHMEGGKHEAIVFGGAQTNKRHINNVNNMEKVLKETWPNGTYNIQKLGDTMPGATRQQLLDAITTAASRLDENTQFVLYIDDHGGATIDLAEAGAAIADVLIEDPTEIELEVPRAWIKNWFGSYFATPPEFPAPGFEMNTTFCEYCDYWGYYLGGEPLYFPMGSSDPLKWIPLDFYRVRPGRNVLEIMPQLPPASVQAAPGPSRPQAGMGGLTFSSLELYSGRANELQADTALVPAHSGAYYNTGRSGEGIYVEVLDERRAVVYMFTYDQDGDQAWMLGVGEVIGEGIVVEELLKPVGARFGDAFDPGDVMRENFGMLAMHLPDCQGNAPGSLFILPSTNFLDWEIFNDFNYSQLTTLLDCNGGGGDPDHPFSGAWYDRSRSGEGIILEVTRNGTVAAIWFTFDENGEQMWVTGTGTITGNRLEIGNLLTVRGPRWGSAFDPGARQNNPWGSLTITFNDCGSAAMSYSSTAGFGNGSWAMQRLTGLWGMDCVD